MFLLLLAPKYFCGSRRRGPWDWRWLGVKEKPYRQEGPTPTVDRGLKSASPLPSAPSSFQGSLMNLKEACL